MFEYALEVEAWKGTMTTRAVAYRGSPYRGRDLPDNVEIPLASGLVHPDEWHKYTVAVDRTKHRFVLFVDGIERGKADYAYDTMSHVDVLNAFAETRIFPDDALCPVTIPEERPCVGTPDAALFYLDDVRVYVLRADDLALLSL